MLHPISSHDNNSHLTLNYSTDEEITVADVLDLLSAMNGEQGYAESLDAWQAWDALSRSADAAMRSRMLEACRQFAQAHASALRMGAA